MEEPISFDVYGIIDTENRVKAVSETLESGIYSSEINARKSNFIVGLHNKKALFFVIC